MSLNDNVAQQIMGEIDALTRRIDSQMVRVDETILALDNCVMRVSSLPSEVEKKLKKEAQVFSDAASQIARQITEKDDGSRGKPLVLHDERGLEKRLGEMAVEAGKHQINLHVNGTLKVMADSLRHEIFGLKDLSYKIKIINDALSQMDNQTNKLHDVMNDQTNKLHDALSKMQQVINETQADKLLLPLTGAGAGIIGCLVGWIFGHFLR